MNEKIRLLTISVNAWNDTNSTGNTFSNVLGGFSNNKVANIFCRNEIPHNNIASVYFKITERDIINKILGRKNSVGRVLKFKDFKTIEEDFQYKNLKGRRPTLLLFARELIWGLGNWKAEALDTFLVNFKPDVIYMHGHMGFYMHKLLKYCQEKTNAKTVLFFGDDMYSYKSYSPFMNLYQFMMRKYLKTSILNADLLYGGSQELCDEYTKIFGKTFKLLYKGIDSINRTSDEKKKDFPITITYTGNLLFGRWETLEMLAKEIEIINKTKQTFFLKIFTQTTITDEMRKKIEIPGSSKIYGKVSYEEVKKLLKKSDIVLHVESFSNKEIKKTRLSFSTKIVDNIQSGSCVMAIGPEKLSSIKYLKNSNSAITISDISDISNVLKNIASNPEIISNYEVKMLRFSDKNHNKKHIQNRVYNELSQLIKC